MTVAEFDSIWSPIFAYEDERAVRALVQSGVNLAGWLGARLHWLVSERGNPAVRSWLESVCLKARARRKIRCSISTLAGEFGESALNYISDQKSGVVLLNADKSGIFGLSQGLSWEKAKLLEHCTLPVWIIPVLSRAKAPPVKSILVPMSGEKRASEALGLGIRLGNQQRVPVDILHVTSSKPKRECDESVLGYIADQFHHEYPGLVEELIAQGSPYSSPRERQVIREFSHCYGDVMSELKGRIRKKSDSLLIFEWKGSLKRGRAKKIKLLLRQASGPILLLREDSKARSRLKIGRQYGVAR